jgi:hypothetical protein
MNTLSAHEQNLNDWCSVHAECERMCQWAFNAQDQVDLCIEVERELMARVHKRCFWYLHPSIMYPSLEAYINVKNAALVADVRVYQAEVAAAEAVHRKCRSEALKAERAAAPPAPACAQPQHTSKRARQRVMCFY